HFADNAKALCVNEAVDQLTALDRTIFVENKHRHVLHVVIERIAERNHLDQRREKKEEQRQRIAPDDDELLKQNCGKAAKRRVFHGCAALRHAKSLQHRTVEAGLSNSPFLPSAVSPFRINDHAAFCRSEACFAESSTNTSSSEGPIS